MKTSVCVLALCCSMVSTACHTLTPVYRASSSYGNNGEQVYHYPEYERHVNWIGYGWMISSTAGGAYGGYVSGVEFDWDGAGVRTEEPAYNAVIGGASGLLFGWLTNTILAPSIPDVDEEYANRWLEDLDPELIRLEYQDYPHKIMAIPEASAETFVATSLADVYTFIRAYPDMTSKRDSVILEAGVDVPRTDLIELADLAVNTNVRDSVRRLYTMTATSLSDAIQDTGIVPEYRALLEEVASKHVNSVRAARTYVDAFPSGAHAPDVLAAVAQGLERSELPTVIELFEGVDGVRDVKRRYVNEASSFSDIEASIEKYPSVERQAEGRMMELATTATDLRRFLLRYPESRYEDTVRARLKEVMSVPENLGRNVNTEYSDFRPVIAPDGKTLYFVRRDHPDNTGYLDRDDIWYSKMNPDGTWRKARRVGPSLNNEDPNSIGSITPDGHQMLLLGSYGVDEAPTSIAVWNGSEWGEPVGLTIERYYNWNQYVNFCLSPDGTKLLMALERSDSYGDLDLYLSTLRSDGSWTAPESLGPKLNTKGSDFGPFLAADGATLYFSSDGLDGLGSSDIWMTRRLDDSWTNWSNPVNIGKPINTEDWDAYLTIPASGEYAYYSSGKDSYGRTDIFRVGLREDVRPLPVVLVSGKAYDESTGDPIGADVVYENLNTGKEVGRARTDPKTGAYKISLPPGARYGFRAEADGYLSVSDNIDLSELRNYEEQTRDLPMIPVRSGERLRLNNLFFEFGRAELQRESFPELDRIAAFMKESPSVAVRIEGHTDSVGSDADNLTLSRERARSVVRYLSSKGVSGSRMQIEGLGESRPVEDNGTEEGRARNRRVEFVIVED